MLPIQELINIPVTTIGFERDLPMFECLLNNYVAASKLHPANRAVACADSMRLKSWEGVDIIYGYAGPGNSELNVNHAAIIASALKSTSVIAIIDTKLSQDYLMNSCGLQDDQVAHWTRHVFQGG